MELIITGRVIDAHEALRIGLVNEVVPRGTCVAPGARAGAAIAALPQPAIRTDKEAAVRGSGRPLDEGLRIEAECFDRSIFSEEMAEGLRRFNERDHPDRVRGGAPGRRRASPRQPNPPRARRLEKSRQARLRASAQPRSPGRSPRPRPGWRAGDWWGSG